MIMEEDKLKSLFAEFQPELSSDSLFMNRLERNMESVEIVKRRVEEMRARNRRAIAVAAIVGFIVVVAVSERLGCRLAGDVAAGIGYECSGRLVCRNGLGRDWCRGRDSSHQHLRHDDIETGTD